MKLDVTHSMVIIVNNSVSYSLNLLIVDLKCCYHTHVWLLEVPVEGQAPGPLDWGGLAVVGPELVELLPAAACG